MTCYLLLLCTFNYVQLSSEKCPPFLFQFNPNFIEKVLKILTHIKYTYVPVVWKFWISPNWSWYYFLFIHYIGKKKHNALWDIAFIRITLFPIVFLSNLVLNKASIWLVCQPKLRLVLHLIHSQNKWKKKLALHCGIQNVIWLFQCRKSAYLCKVCCRNSISSVIVCYSEHIRCVWANLIPVYLTKFRHTEESWEM